MGSLAVDLFGGIYNNKNVFITGHTGFKGSWLAYWLNEMGAKVYGYALVPPSEPNHFDLLDFGITSNINDVRNSKLLHQALEESKPEIVFHLAAQPLVRDSYTLPIDTLDTNIMGTAHLLESCRKIESVKSIIVITSDKCYENKEWMWPYRENEPLGGHDPYSASKACAELIVSTYKNSFFHPDNFGFKHNTLISSARAGNVIGGGDWAKDRLLPDIVKATAANKTIEIRSPQAIRPWQHVLESLSGYLLLGWRLLQGKVEYSEAWNFGPNPSSFLTVEEILNLSVEYWDTIRFNKSAPKESLHEANLLKLDSTKAKEKLNWQNVWDSRKAIEKTINWYKNYYQKNKINTSSDLLEYIEEAKKHNLIWITK